MLFTLTTAYPVFVPRLLSDFRNVQDLKHSGIAEVSTTIPAFENISLADCPGHKSLFLPGTGAVRRSVALKSSDSIPECLPFLMKYDLAAEINRIGNSIIKQNFETVSNEVEYLDHIHEYESSGDVVEDSFTLDLHYDMGLLLIITPKSGLVIELNDTLYEVKVTNPSNLLVLVGAAIPYFLGVSDYLPSMHGVVAQSVSRTVYARMYLLAPHYIGVNGDPFGDFFKSRHNGSHNDSPFRRLAEESCKEDEKWCWMQCMKLDRCSYTSECWNYRENTECDENACDDNCKLKCPNDDISLLGSSEFCDASIKASMLMRGFHSNLFGKNRGGVECIVLFWAHLRTELRFLLGMLICFLFGILVELSILARKKATNIIIVNWMFLGINISLGYGAMLIAMTYSIELFCSLIIGVGCGHLIFGEPLKAVDYVSNEPCCMTAPSSLQPRIKSCECSGDK
jgi:hypothetical protein